MSVNISVTSNIVDVVASMKDLPDRIIWNATRVSINRALTTGRKEAAKSLKDRLNVKSRNMKKKMAITKARGGNLRSLEGKLSFDDKPIPLLQFVKGSKNKIAQKGIKIRKRRKLKVEITKGKRFHLKGGFIQKVRSRQVFKRGKSGRLYKQSAPSVAEWIGRSSFRKPVEKAMKKSFDTNLKNQLSFRMDKEAKLLSSKRMRKI